MQINNVNFKRKKLKANTFKDKQHNSYTPKAEATREKQEQPIEIQRKAFERTQFNNRNVTHIKRKRKHWKTKRNCTNSKANRVRHQQSSNTYSSQRKHQLQFP